MTKWIAAALVAIALNAGCSSGSGGDRAQRPRSAPEDAVAALLRAEQRGDHAASYALLSEASRATYRDVADWSRLRSQVPAITGFAVEPASGDSVVALVDHAPGLDPFIGLSPARARETWSVVADGDAWRVDAEPMVEPVLPDRDGAAPAALAWARAVQACDASATSSLQAVARVLGSSQGADSLCGSTGDLDATPVDVPVGPQTADLVSQYSTDALSWGASVRIDGGPSPFGVVLAPLGDDWRVVAVFDG